MLCLEAFFSIPCEYLFTYGYAFLFILIELVRRVYKVFNFNFMLFFDFLVNQVHQVLCFRLNS